MWHSIAQIIQPWTTLSKQVSNYRQKGMDLILSSESSHLEIKAAENSATDDKKMLVLFYHSEKKRDYNLRKKTCANMTGFG